MSIETQNVQVDGQPISIQGGNSTAVKVDGSAVTQPVSGTVTANQGTAGVPAGSWPVEMTDGTNILGTAAHPVRIDPTGTTTQPVSGTVTTTPVTSSTATISQVTANTTSALLLASNANRKKAIIFIASSTVLIAYGASAASASNFTYKITSNNTTIEVDVWTGALQVVTTAGTSLITVTELT